MGATLASNNIRNSMQAQGGWLSRVEAIARQPWFAYATVLLIQLRRVWNLWQYRDLSGGDTCAYFDVARLWSTQLRTDVVWSPLYTVFYGTVVHFCHDAAVATVLHRVLIILAAAALVLAAARRFLPKPMAWLIALWWVMLPVNFDPAYEVHLFALLPILLAWWVIAGPTGAWWRGIALGLLLLEALLVRNEYVLSFACMVVALLVYERRLQCRVHWRAYVVPVVLALAPFLIALLRTPGGLPRVREEMRVKHTLNMAQVYAQGYAQRHPDWRRDPSTEYDDITTRDFGVPEPSIAQMARRNPAALLNHVAWNFRLLPAGLQVMLFGATSGRLNPDYEPVTLNARYALVLSPILLAAAVAGAIFWWRERRLRMRAWRNGRWLGWAALGSVLVVMPLIIATQRPRAEYLYPLSLFLMIVSALGVFGVVARRPQVRRKLGLLPAVLLLPALCVPSHYRVSQPRPLLAHYRMLRPFQARLQAPQTTFLSHFGPALEHYLGYNRSRAFDYSVFRQMRSGQTMAAFLESRGINLIEISPQDRRELRMMHPGILDRFEAEAGRNGWQRIASQASPAGPWMIFARAENAVTSAATRRPTR